MHPLSMVRTRSTASLTPPTTSRAGVPPATGLQHVARKAELAAGRCGGRRDACPPRQTLLARADSSALAGPRAPFHKTNKTNRTTKESK